MATLFHPRPDSMTAEKTHYHAQTRLFLWAVPLGRFFLSLIFVLSGINHFSSASIGYAASQGIPMADILVPVSGVISLIGGLSVMTGFHARVGAVLLLMFLVPVTLLMHNFWSFGDPEMAQIQMVNFMKNLSIIGGAVLIAFYGAGPVSIDNFMAKKGHRT